MKKNVKYEGGYDANHNICVWLFEILTEFSEE